MERICSLICLISTNIQSSMKKRHIKTRPGASPGVWLTFLLPIAVLAGLIKSPDATLLYQRTGLFSVGLLIAAIIDIIYTEKSKGFSTQIHQLSLISSSIFTGLLLYQFHSGEVYLCMLWGFCSVFSYNLVLNKILTSSPLIFSFGEASVVAQALILFVFTTCFNIHNAWHETPQSCLDISTTILQIGLLGITLICGTVHIIPELRSPIPFYGVCAAILVGLVVPMLHVLLDQSPVLWILQLLVANTPRILIVIYWVLCVVVAVVAVTSQINTQQKASTVVRKYFHILAVVVYVPGLIQEGCLLYLASGIVFAVFVVLELLRVLRMPPLGAALQDGFAAFADEKDAGALALTPVYLLAACSLPLWLHPAPSAKQLLPLLGGVLSVGVGDTCASAAGTRFGRHRWPGDTKKTIEGTLGCIFSQLFVVALLIYLGYLDGTFIVCVKSVIAIIVTSIVEAKTDQVDNLVLPLIMYVLLL